MTNNNRSGGDFLSNLNRQRFEQEVAEEIAADRNKPEKRQAGSANVYGTNTASAVGPKGDETANQGGHVGGGRQASGSNAATKPEHEKH